LGIIGPLLNPKPIWGNAHFFEAPSLAAELQKCAMTDAQIIWSRIGRRKIADWGSSPLDPDSEAGSKSKDKPTILHPISRWPVTFDKTH